MHDAHVHEMQVQMWKPNTWGATITSARFGGGGGGMFSSTSGGVFSRLKGIPPRPRPRPRLLPPWPPFGSTGLGMGARPWFSRRADRRFNICNTDHRNFSACAISAYNSI